MIQTRYPTKCAYGRLPGRRDVSCFEVIFDHPGCPGGPPILMLDDTGAGHYPDLAGSVFTAQDIPVIWSDSRRVALVQAGFKVVDKLPEMAQD